MTSHLGISAVPLASYALDKYVLPERPDSSDEEDPTTFGRRESAPTEGGKAEEAVSSYPLRAPLRAATPAAAAAAAAAPSAGPMVAANTAAWGVGYAALSSSTLSTSARYWLAVVEQGWSLLRLPAACRSCHPCQPPCCMPLLPPTPATPDLKLCPLHLFYRCCLPLAVVEQGRLQRRLPLEGERPNPQVTSQGSCRCHGCRVGLHRAHVGAMGAGRPCGDTKHPMKPSTTEVLLWDCLHKVLTLER